MDTGCLRQGEQIAGIRGGDVVPVPGCYGSGRLASYRDRPGQGAPGGAG